MIHGHVRDYLPRVVLSLPGREQPVSVEFVVDTGFDGDLALPAAFVARLDAYPMTERTLRLADGSEIRQPVYQITLDWDEEPRLTEIALLEGEPLMGAVLLDGFSLYIEMADGGEVQIEPL